LYAFEAQIHIYILKRMAMQYEVSTGHTIPKNLNTTITHQSYCCLNFTFYELLITFSTITGITTVTSPITTQMSHV
jgi:hypothetical protein